MPRLLWGLFHWWKHALYIYLEITFYDFWQSYNFIVCIVWQHRYIWIIISWFYQIVDRINITIKWCFDVFRCNGKSVCIVPIVNEIFGDPCPTTYKYMELYFACITSKFSRHHRMLAINNDNITETIKEWSHFGNVCLVTWP